MNVADFFVNLGIKGQDKTLSGVMKVKDGLKETASTSLEAKAAILGAMYALQRFFSESGRTGQGLANFSATVGESAKALQQYQYAAQQVGVSNQEVEGSFRSVQSVMTKTLMGEAKPMGLGRFAQVMGNVTAKDLKEWAEAPEKFMAKMQEYALKERSIPLRNEVMKSFGLGGGVIDALNRNAFRPDVLRRAPTYSDREIQSLAKADAAWANLGTKIEMAVGRFNAKHGGELVKDISSITDKVLKLSEAFVTLAEKLKFFEVIGKAFEGWSLIFDGWAKAADIVGGEFDAGTKQGRDAPEAAADALGSVFSNIFKMVTENLSLPDGLKSPAPTATPQSGGKTTTDNSTKQDIKVTQTFVNNGAPDNAGQAAAMKRAVSDALRSQPQGRSN